MMFTPKDILHQSTFKDARPFGSAFRITKCVRIYVRHFYTVEDLNSHENLKSVKSIVVITASLLI